MKINDRSQYQVYIKPAKFGSTKEPTKDFVINGHEVENRIPELVSAIMSTFGAK